MIVAPEHQVAGHQAREGQLGPLTDGEGHFYKPLTDDDRGEREKSFYESFFFDPHVPARIKKFFPVFDGTQVLDSSDGSGPRTHLVLEDLVVRYSRPSVVDFKIGARTWYRRAPEDYIRRCFLKDRQTSSVELGFRISGLQIYGVGGDESLLWKPDRKTVQNLNPDGVRSVLRKFVSSNFSPDPSSANDGAHAATVFGDVLIKLSELKAWFELQTAYQFNSCSILMICEKDSTNESRSRGDVKLVDFAHVVDSGGVIDHNFLGGLSSLINFISEISDVADDKSSSI